MDHLLIGSLCKKLILTHNRVSLPGIGSFMAEEVPASFQNQGHILLPPSRRIFFRSSETWNDELLENALAQYRGISLAASKSILSQYVSELRRTMEKTRSVTFDDFGTLRRTNEGQIFFVAARSLSLYPEGFGLVPLAVGPLEEDEIAEEAPVKESLVENQQEEEEEVITSTEQSIEWDNTPYKKAKWPFVVFGILAFMIIAIFLIYAFREPLRPILERILYNAEDLQLIRSLR